MMFKILLIGMVALASVTRWTEALKCAQIDISLCTPVGPCEWGEGLDPCGNCPVCLKGPKEECGGPWNISGVCGTGLRCTGDVNAVGKCVRLHRG